MNVFSSWNQQLLVLNKIHTVRKLLLKMDVDSLVCVSLNGPTGHISKKVRTLKLLLLLVVKLTTKRCKNKNKMTIKPHKVLEM